MACRNTFERITIQSQGGGATNGSFKSQWADPHKTITMITQQIYVYIVMVSGIILFFAGCAFKNYAPHEEAQFDRTPGTSLAGSYKDIGSDGSIKPHPATSYKIRQEPTDSAIILGGPTDLPDLKTGTIQKKPPSRMDPASDPEGKRK